MKAANTFNTTQKKKKKKKMLTKIEEDKSLWDRIIECPIYNKELNLKWNFYIFHIKESLQL